MQKDGPFLHLSVSYTFLPSFLGSSLSMLPACSTSKEIMKLGVGFVV